jgi:Protein of unknown function (DUF2721)
MNPSDTEAALVAHAIQLAVAPVFLLAGIGAFLNVLMIRLGRVIDRSRLVERDWLGREGAARTEAKSELESLQTRALNVSAIAELLICFVIAALFVDAFLGTHLKWFVSGLFIVSMAAMVAGLVPFLREVHIAMRSLRSGLPA